ncbi:hypothetical protein [Streptomyces sp. NPDC004783]|uniref:hypothetical protein n=1 Tax=Streptomyces sp. NPDC004783 TaxID=3154459 RepID=UPI0033AD6684
MSYWTHGGKTTTYAWDAAGNRTTAGTATATNDARNRLLDDGASTYTYDSLDRVAKQGTTTFRYDGGSSNLLCDGTTDYSIHWMPTRPNGTSGRG